jgi:hypothetical protein
LSSAYTALRAVVIREFFFIEYQKTINAFVWLI